MAQVVLDRVYKSYDKTDVIRDVSLQVEDREFVVLVGPSGCGKSTVLRMIAGLESLTSGTIQIGDRVVNEVAPKDRDIAMVFQNYALYPHMSVYDNMAFGLKMRKTPKAEIDRRVKEAAGILDLSTLLERKPKQLSGGQRQRVALGRAIVRDPKVFLMDEPLSNLDAKLRHQMRTEIAKLHQRLHATTVYVTHDQVEAMTMGDRIVILNKGVIQQVGQPMVLYANPINLFVAGFIGQMNLLSGIVSTGRFNLQTQSRDSVSLSLPDSLIRAAQEYGEKALMLGLRPEHIVPPDMVAEEYRLTVTPDLVEPLGSEQLVHFTVAGQPMMAKLPPEFQTPVGQPVQVGLNLQHAHLFDPQTEARIS